MRLLTNLIATAILVMVAAVILLPAAAVAGLTWAFAEAVLWALPVEPHWSLYVLTFLAAAWIVPTRLLTVDSKLRPSDPPQDG